MIDHFFDKFFYPYIKQPRGKNLSMFLLNLTYSHPEIAHKTVGYLTVTLNRCPLSGLERIFTVVEKRVFV